MFWNKKAQGGSLKAGQWGESQALQYLTRSEYTIITTNYRKRYGEIDIIAQIDELLVFIEVKYRTRQDYGSALEAVDWRKQQRICKVALAYLQSHNCGDCSARFDVIAVYPAEGRGVLQQEARIEHIENAFDFCL